MKTQRRKFVIFVVAIAAMIYVGNILIDNPYTHGLVNYYINERILKKLPIRAEYQSMKLELAPPAVHIYGTRISSNEDNAPSQELLSISTLSFKASIWAALMASPQLGNLELSDVKLKWPPPKSLLDAVGKMFPSDPIGKVEPAQWPPASPPPVAFVHLKNATIDAEFPGVSLNINQMPNEVTRLFVDGLNLKFEIHDWKSFKLDIQSNDINISDRSVSYFDKARVNFRGEMRNDKFVTRKFELMSENINLLGKAEVNIAKQKGTNNISDILVELTAEKLTSDLSLLGSFLDITGNRGEIDGRASVKLGFPILKKGPLSFLTEGSIKSKDARFYDFRLYETETKFKIDLDKFKFVDTNIKIGSQSVAKGSGAIYFDRSTNFEVDLVPSALPMRDLLGIFNVNFDSLNFDLTSPLLKIKGVGAPFKMSITSNAVLSNFTTPAVEYDHSAHKEQPQCDMSLNINIDSKELRFSQASGTCHINGIDSTPGKFPLTISGFTGFSTKHGMDLTLSSDLFNPAPLSYFAQASLSGQGKMRTQIHGRYDKVKINIDTDIENAIIGSTPAGGIKGSAEIYKDQLSWQNLEMRSPSGGVVKSPKGSLSLVDPMIIDFDIFSQNLESAIIGSALKDLTRQKSSLELSLNHLSASLKGPVKQPLRWQGNLDIQARDIRDHDNFYAKSATGRISGTSTGYSADGFALTTGGMNAIIDASHIWKTPNGDPSFLGDSGLSLDDKIDLSVKISPDVPNKRDINLLPIIGKAISENKISANIAGDAKFAGSFKKQTGLIRLSLTKASILDALVSDINATMIVDGGKLDIMAEQGGSALKARMNIDLGNTQLPYNWYISAKNADFRPWMPNIMSQDARNFAYLSATWNLQGTLTKWWESKGTLDLKDLRVRFYSPSSKSGQRIDIKSTHPSHVSFDGKQWSTQDNAPIELNSSMGRVGFSLNNHRPPTNLGLYVDGKIELDALKTFSNEVEHATGEIQILGGLTGSILDPQLDININTIATPNGENNVSIGLASFRPTLQNITLNSKITQNGLSISKLTATKGNGSISVSGFLSRPGSVADTDLAINLDNASFLYPFPLVKYFDSNIDGQIKISGHERPWNTAGRIIIRKARSNRDIDLREAIFESIRSQNTIDSTDSISPTTNLDLSIVSEDSIGFNSRAAQATLAADLKIGGNNLAPSIVGLVNVTKGRFFYKRDFEIKRGLINFDDPIKADPSLDINAISDVGNYRVGINISGRASNSIIDFSIDPPTRPDGTAISKMDIISLLNRGSLPDSIATSNNSESAAASEALNIFAGQVEDIAEKIFDLSGQNVIRQVYIDTYADSEGTPVARFNLPLNITEDFDVILKVDQSTVKVSSEYSLHDSISLTGGIESINESTSNKNNAQPADTGVDLKFKFAFP